VKWLVVALAVAACNSDSTPTAPAQPPPVIPTTEVQRAVDACEAYVTKVCKCAETVAAAKDRCDLARGLPEALEISKHLAANPKAEREDALAAGANIRKIVKQCVELTAKLVDICPP
jgi:hypothetical protein